MIRVVVLISGRGSNLGALLRAADDAHYRVTGVVSNRADAAGLEFAREADIPTRVIPHGDFDSRESFDRKLATVIDGLDPDLIVLAGFMRILSDEFVARYEGRMINIHPSLLPDFRGLNTHARALEAGRSEHGASVHYVTAELDGGPVIAQARIPVEPGDSPEALAGRLLRVEHRLLPHVVELIATGRVEWRNGTVFCDGRPLTEPLQPQF